MPFIILIIVAVILAGVGLVTFGYYSKQKSKTAKKAPTSKGGLGGDKDQLATIFSSIEDGLILIDDKGTIVLLNSAAGYITGWKVEEAVGISIELVVKLVDDKGSYFTGSNYPFNKAMSSAQSIQDKTSQLVTKDNKRVSVDIRISPLKDPTGKVTGAVALVTNITEEKQQEGRLADFISTASHEMRTPVAAIEGYLSLALNSKVATIDGRAREYLEKAETATRHLGTLFQDLLTSAKAEDGRLVSHPQVIEMGQYLRALTDDLKFVAEKRDLHSNFSLGSTSANTTSQVVAPLYYTFADPDRLREVITNLYDNAVKYTSQGSITVGITGDDDVIQFYIRDTGNGIPKEDIPHLFQKFYRVDNSATRTIGGNGLGLFICRKIVELYNGRIWVESEVSKGSTFYINLPRLSNQKATEMLENKGAPNIIMANTTTSEVS